MIGGDHMRDFVRRTQQAVAREVDDQLRDAEPEPYVMLPEEEALMDAYEASFARMFDDEFDDLLGLPTVTVTEDDFECDCEFCRMQDF
jgi:hypothetical protein